MAKWAADKVKAAVVAESSTEGLLPVYERGRTEPYPRPPLPRGEKGRNEPQVRWHPTLWGKPGVEVNWGKTIHPPKRGKVVEPPADEALSQAFPPPDGVMRTTP